MTVGAGEASYLQMYENANDGWKATLNGKKLTPLRLDGWQQAWLIPAGAGGTVKLEYEPVLTLRRRADRRRGGAWRCWRVSPSCAAGAPTPAAAAADPAGARAGCWAWSR